MKYYISGVSKYTDPTSKPLYLGIYPSRTGQTTKQLAEATVFNCRKKAQQAANKVTAKWSDVCYYVVINEHRAKEIFG